MELLLILAIITVPILIIIGFGGALIIAIKRIFNGDNKSNEQTNTLKAHEYKAKPILTQNEWINYLGMREYAAAHGLIICPKVRLADLLDPITGTRSEWHKRFNKIKAKHVDFVLCDPDIHVRVIVELDDSSHSRPDRIERDQFVDTALIGAGYKIVHIQKFNDAGIAALDAILDPKPETPLQTEEAAIG